MSHKWQHLIDAGFMEICDTCDGSGTERVQWHNDVMAPIQVPVPCPDCVDGIRLLRGELIEHCIEHDAEIAYRSPFSNQDGGWCWKVYHAGASGRCVFEVQWKDNLK